MKKFLSAVSMSALALCLTSQVSHGMENEEDPSSQKRTLPFCNDSQSIQDEEEREICFEGLLPIFGAVIASHLDSDPIVDKNQTFQLRLVNHKVKKAIDSNIGNLDFSHFSARSLSSSISSPQYWTDTDGHTFYYFQGLLYLWDKARPLNPLSDASTNDWCICKPRRGERYFDGEALFCSWNIWPYRWSGACEETPHALYRYNSWNVMRGDCLPNPFSSYFNDFSMNLTDFSSLKNLKLGNNPGIRDEQLSFLPQLLSLDLYKNRTITNTGLSYLPNLKVLNLNRNTEITADGLAQLTRLEELNLVMSSRQGESSIAINALYPLTMLKKLTVDFSHKDIGESLHLPSLKKLYVTTDHSAQDVYKLAIDVADTLFLHVEDTKEKYNNFDVPKHKNDYFKVITIICSLYPEITSKLLEGKTSIPMTLESLQDLAKRAGALERSKDGDIYIPDDDIFGGLQAPVTEILKALLERFGKEIEIFYESQYDGQDFENLLDLSKKW